MHNEKNEYGLADCEFNRTLLGNQTMKYYIGKIEERNGDCEYSTEYLFKTEGNPHDYTEKKTKDWYGSSENDWDEDHEGYWCDCALIFNGGYKKVSEEDFEVLSKHLIVL